MRNVFFAGFVILTLSSCIRNTQSHIPVLGKKPLSKSLYRGVYIDSTSFFLGDTAKENHLLRWCLQNKITSLAYFDLNRVMLSGKASRLAYFMKLARTDFNIKDNSAVVGSANFAHTVIDTFNNSKTDTLQRFNWCNLELEWWNGDGSFDQYISKLKSLKAWGDSQFPRVGTEEYIGWFRNPSGMDSIMADKLIQNSDRILVHNYYPIPSWSYMSSRVNYLANAAKALNRKANLIVIFNSDPTVTGPYFKSHPFDRAFCEISKGFNSSVMKNKASINLMGYHLFKYDFARSARPLATRVLKN